MRITRATSSGLTQWNVRRDSAQFTVVEDRFDASIGAALAAHRRASVTPDSAAHWRQRHPFEPNSVLGIGLNYPQHAQDLSAVPTDLPTVFFKGRHTLIGPGDSIVLPPDSARVTAEAELGLVVGERMRDVSPDRAFDHIAGAVCVLDQTAEDILRKDARLLTVAKNFATFFAFGPELVTLDELMASGSTLEEIRIGTYRNGDCVAEAEVGAMRFSPAALLTFLSRLMPLEPGDIISTGTPGAVALSAGDVVECRISGLQPLVVAVEHIPTSHGTAATASHGSGER